MKLKKKNRNITKLPIKTKLFKFKNTEKKWLKKVVQALQCQWINSKKRKNQMAKAK